MCCGEAHHGIPDIAEGEVRGCVRAVAVRGAGVGRGPCGVRRPCGGRRAGSGRAAVLVPRARPAQVVMHN